MEIEEPQNQNNQLLAGKEKYADKMKKIYESIINDPNLKSHICSNRDERIRFIHDYPYDNLPHNETFLFNNICMFSNLSQINGYIITKDEMNAIDFNGNYKYNEKVNMSQRCLLPENLFYSKYDFQNFIIPLDEKSLNDYLLKK